MKILELRFKNLNSLYGGWFIDFSDPEYVSNGIFALTGPTGAGKSTILDAICLALYGATPRLGKITKSSNEIMSRHTGECYAEVMFESQTGRYRCHWSQQRAHKKVHGNLVDARHEISDVETGKPIETKKSLVPNIVEDKTGMDFERFTRSILLAQGGFDTFLKASVEQKSKILEQITGTKIYTQISRRVHERQRDEREKLNLLKAETSGIAILEPEQEKEIQHDLESKQKQETGLAVKTTKTGKAITWLTAIDGLKKEISSLLIESEELQIKLKSFKPEQELFTRALKAAELDGEYATLTAVQKQQTADQISLKKEAGKLPELENLFKQNKNTLNVAEKQTVKAKEDMKTAAPLIQRVRFLDQKLADQKKIVKAEEAGCKKDEAKIDDARQIKVKEQDNLDNAGIDLKVIEEYLKDHSQDEWLVSGIAGVEEQLHRLFFKQKEITQQVVDEKKAQITLNQAKEKLEACSKQCSIQKKKLDDAVEFIEQEKNALKALLGDKLLREYRTEKETVLRERAFLAQIKKLEEHRLELTDGKPCPLCGAEEHPFAQGNVPVPDKIDKKIEALDEFIPKAEEHEFNIKKLETAEKEFQEKLTKSEKLEAAARNEKKAVKKMLSDLTDNLRAAQPDSAKLKEAILIKLKPLGFKNIPDSDVSLLLKSLQERLKKWQTQDKKKAEIEKQLLESESELKRINAVIETQKSALVEKQKTLDSIKKKYADGNTKRWELYGDKKPDSEENQLNEAIAHAELAEKEAGILHNEALQKLNSTKTNIVSLKERIKKRILELEKIESDFELFLQSAGFTSEKQFLNAHLTAKELDELKTKAKKLDDQQADIKARQKDRKSRLATEIDKKITDNSLEELEPQLRDFEENLKQIRYDIAGLKHKLTENIKARERIKEKQAAIKAQKREYHRWKKLHALIGSNDGKKYRNFAQGLTFELMVSHANRQLEKMTDRYLLIRDDEQPLELNVVDNYQAGEIRSIRNLSGGESFIVSLTLALGLSQMASRKVRVDSLFLDEGFGTLDEEALETSLETLSGLHQDGKLIGIISHVSALKERIATQINIVPLSGGKSRITGPGCKSAV